MDTSEIIMSNVFNMTQNIAFQAAGLGRTEIVEYILSRCKRTVSIQDHESRTPLHYAAALKDNGQIYTLLKETGANEETLDKVSWTTGLY